MFSAFEESGFEDVLDGIEEPDKNCTVTHGALRNVAGEVMAAVPISTQFSDKTVLYTNAGVCMKRVDLAVAEDYLRQALSSDPRNAEALLQIADVAFQRGNYLQARAFLERHLDVSPKAPASLWLGYQVETAMNDFGAADVYGSELRARFPESVETRLLLEKLRESG